MWIMGPIFRISDWGNVWRHFKVSLYQGEQKVSIKIFTYQRYDRKISLDVEAFHPAGPCAELITKRKFEQDANMKLSLVQISFSQLLTLD